MTGRGCRKDLVISLKYGVEFGQGIQIFFLDEPQERTSVYLKSM
jgi:hypothetical protein